MHFAQHHPHLTELIPRFMGNDAARGAAAFTEATREVNDAKPRLALAEGRTVPNDVVLDTYSEETHRWRAQLRDAVQAALPLAREEAARARAEEGVATTLLPPELVDVPPDFLNSEFEKLAERLEYHATVTLGILWHHVLSKIPAALERGRTALTLRPLLEHVKAVIASLPSPSEHRKRQEEIFKEMDPEAPPPRFSLSLITSAVKLAVNAMKAKRAHKNTMASELQEMAETAGRMPMPPTIDPRDWAMFLANRFLYYWAYIAEKMRMARDIEPSLEEDRKRMQAVLNPMISSWRDEIIDLLKDLEAKVPPPWDPKEYDRVRENGMQARMTMKEAALILGLTNNTVLEGEVADQELKEAHRAVMRVNHPDTLGSNYLALKINKAKEVLSKGSEVESPLYDMERADRAKLSSPDYQAAAVLSATTDPETERLNRLDKEVAAAFAAKLRAKRKVRSWYWHKNTLLRRVLGIGPPFFPIHRESIRIQRAMKNKKKVRREVRRQYRDFMTTGGDPDNEKLSTWASKWLEYRRHRKRGRRKWQGRKRTKLRLRIFSYWFYWRLSRPLPLLWRVPLFTFVRLPLILTLYPLAFVGVALVYPWILLARVLRPIPRLLFAPFGALTSFVQRSFRAVFASEPDTEWAREEKHEKFSKRMERFKSKSDLRRMWRRFSQAIYERAHPDDLRPDWDPDYLKQTVREELANLKKGRKAINKAMREKRVIEDEDLADEEEAYEEEIDESSRPTNVATSVTDAAFEKLNAEERRKRFRSRYQPPPPPSPPPPPPSGK